MNRLVRNLWMWITFASALVFVIPVIAAVPADWAVQTHRILLFVVVGVAFSRYVARAPVLWWEGNSSPEAKQIIGFAIVLAGLLYQLAYSWIYVQMGRPDWLAQTYWSDGSVYVLLIGFLLVAWSTRSPSPHVRGNRLTSYLVGVLTGLGLMLSGALPQTIKLIGLAAGRIAALMAH